MSESDNPQGADHEIENTSPQKLMINFNRNRVLKCLAIALGVHVVLIFGTSPRYIYETFNPEAKKARIEREQLASQAEVDERSKSARAPTASGDDAASAATDSDDDRRSTQEYKTITETAGPDEIPLEPDDLDISIEDTAL